VEAVMTDFQMAMIAEMFLDVIKSSKDLKEAEERIQTILKNAKKSKASADE
jgi:hypothetical protein